MASEEFILVFALPETKGKSDMRQSILDSIKAFIGNIDAVRDFNVSIRKRTIWVENGGFEIYFSSEKTFKVVFKIDEEKAVESVSVIMNQIFAKLNKMNMKKAKSMIAGIFRISHELDDKHEPFSRLVRKEALEYLSKIGPGFAPKSIMIQTPRAKKGKWSRFGIRVDITKNILDVVLFNVYRNRFPKDLLKKAIIDLKEQLDKVLAILREE